MYRTAAPRAAADTAVVCRSCGARSSVAFEEARLATFTCAGCAREQPVLRPADDLAPSQLRLVEHRPADAYPELTPLLASFGVEGAATQASLECDGIPIAVALQIDSGTVRGLDVVAPAPGLPSMLFVREGHMHQRVKDRGLVREVQTGDDAFDRAVYVESSLRDDDVRTVLSSPAVRAAVTRLLEATERVELKGGQVEVHYAKAKDTFDPDAIRQRVGLARVVAGAPRRASPEQAPIPRAARVARLATWLQLPVALAAGAYGGAGYTPVETKPWVITIAIGVVLALVLRPLFRRALRGRSTSHHEIGASAAVSLVFLPVLTSGVLFVVNGAFDRSPEREVIMEVRSTSVDDDDASKIHVEAVDDEGRTHEYTFRARRPTAPARVTARWRAGALGWTWESGPATLSQLRLPR